MNPLAQTSFFPTLYLFDAMIPSPIYTPHSFQTAKLYWQPLFDLLEILAPIQPRLVFLGA